MFLVSSESGKMVAKNCIKIDIRNDMYVDSYYTTPRPTPPHKKGKIKCSFQVLTILDFNYATTFPNYYFASGTWGY